jgi:hypothetical protein
MSVPRCRGLRWPPSSKSCSTLYESRRQSTPGSDRAVPGSKSRSTLYESRLSMRSSLRRLARKPVASCSTLYESRHPASRTKAPAGIRSKSCSTLYESRRTLALSVAAVEIGSKSCSTLYESRPRGARASARGPGGSKSCSTLYESRQGCIHSRRRTTDIQRVARAARAARRSMSRDPLSLSGESGQPKRSKSCSTLYESRREAT